MLGRQVLQLPISLPVELYEHQVPNLKHIGIICSSSSQRVQRVSPAG